MAQTKPSGSEHLQALIGDLKAPLWDDRLNQAFWAHDRRVAFPLTHYDEETWEGCLREGDPTARAVTQPEAILRHIEEKWPGSRLQLTAQNGRAHVTLLITGLGRGVEGEFKGEVPLTELGRAIAIAFLRADDMAVSLQQRLLAVSDLEGRVPPYQDWPVEEVTPGRWGAVHHELQLLCATANSAEGAARHAGMNHKGDYGLMLCRERYEALFAEADRVIRSGAAADTPTLHLFGSGGDYDLAVANGVISPAIPMTGDFDLAPGDPNGTARPAIEALDRISKVSGDRAIIDNELLGTALYFLVAGDPKPELRIHGTLREFTERKIRELDLETTHVVRRETPPSPDEGFEP